MKKPACIKPELWLMGYQTTEGSYATSGLYSAKNFCLTDIPSCYIGQRTATFIFMFHSCGVLRLWSQCRVFADPGLNAGFFIGRQNIIFRPQRFPIPETSIEIQNRSCLFKKSRVTREYPTSVSPGTNGVGMEPTPQGSSTDLSYNPSGDDFSANFANAEPGQRNPMSVRKFTC